MVNQKVLEDCIERMGVSISKHPSGTVIVSQGGEFFQIFPHPERWTYRVKRAGEVLAYQSGFFTRTDVDLFVHKILTWAWGNGLQQRDYKY